MLTPKENYLKLLNGEIPDWVPSYSYYGPFPGVPEPPPNGSIRPAFLMGNRTAAGGKDIWGVEWIPTYETGGFSLPKPNDFILTDIRKWRDVIKAPDISGFDWEAMGKKDLDNLTIDRSQTALNFGVFFGYFQTLMSFMGFNEGMCAMYEEPEEVKALFAYLNDFYCAVIEKLVDIYKPDIIGLTDDTAAERAPFISKEMYHDFLIPLYDRHAKFGRDRGLPITMHNCGASAVYFDDLAKIGVVAWDPVQLVNPIKEVQAKFGRRLVICGGWEGRGRLLEPDVTDEELIESVHVALDTYAPNGGFMFAGSFMGPADDPVTKHKNEVLQKEVYKYGHEFYKKH
jgi:hypothetical protein